MLFVNLPQKVVPTTGRDTCESFPPFYNSNWDTNGKLCKLSSWFITIKTFPADCFGTFSVLFNKANVQSSKKCPECENKRVNLVSNLDNWFFGNRNQEVKAKGS